MIAGMNYYRIYEDCYNRRCWARGKPQAQKILGHPGRYGKTIVSSLGGTLTAEKDIPEAQIGKVF